MSRKKTREEFIASVEKKNPRKYSFDNFEYKGNKVKAKVICNECGREFEIRPNDLLTGYGCSYCCHKGKSTKTYDTAEFVRRAKELYGDRYIYEKTIYINNRTKVIITCPVHGDFEITPNKFLMGRGCRKCAGNAPKTTEQFIEESKACHKNQYLSYEKTEYKSYHKLLCITCNKKNKDGSIHGDFWVDPANHLHGLNSCPVCSESKMERQIRNLLLENKINFIAQYSPDWLGRQSLDFYLPDYNIGIECQGEQHYVPTKFSSNMTEEDLEKNLIANKNRDKLKLEKCLANLVEILYFSTAKESLMDENVIRDEKVLINEILKHDRNKEYREN